MFSVTSVSADNKEVQPLFVTETVKIPELDTVIEFELLPFDQVLFEDAEEVNVVEPPSQKDKPVLVIVGVAGIGITETVTSDEGSETQPFSVTVIVYVPLDDTTIFCVVSPFDHSTPFATEDASITFPPEQNESSPCANILGVAGIGLTVTVTGSETEEQPFVVTVTKYVPDSVTVKFLVVIAGVVFHELLLIDEDLKVTDSPSQKTIGSLFTIVIVGTGGIAGSTKVAVTEFEGQRPSKKLKV